MQTYSAAQIRWEREPHQPLFTGKPIFVDPEVDAQADYLYKVNVKPLWSMTRVSYKDEEKEFG